MPSVAASDAIFTVDGLSITRSSNIITDVPVGHRLDINAVSTDEFGLPQKLSHRMQKRACNPLSIV